MSRLWIKKRLLEIGKDQKALARHLDVNPSQVSRIIRTARRISDAEVRRLSEFLGYSVSEIHDRLAADFSDGPLSIPISGYIGDHGMIIDTLPDNLSDKILKRLAHTDVPAPRDFDGKAFVILSDKLVRYEIGDILYFRSSRLEDADRQECVVTLKDGSKRLRRLIKTGEPDLYTLVSRTGSVETDEPVAEVMVFDWLRSAAS